MKKKNGGDERGKISVKKSQNSNRTSGAAIDFHWSHNDDRSGRRYVLQIGDVLQVIEALRQGVAMDRKIGGWSVIDAKRINAQTESLPCLYQKLCGVERKAREVHHALGVRVPVGFGRIPAGAPSGAQHNHRSEWNLMVYVLPGGDILHRKLIVRIAPYFVVYIDQDQWGEQTLRRNLIHRPKAACEMRRGIDMRSEMLGQRNVAGQIAIFFNGLQCPSLETGLGGVKLRNLAVDGMRKVHYGAVSARLGDGSPMLREEKDRQRQHIARNESSKLHDFNSFWPPSEVRPPTLNEPPLNPDF
jgi:hypothetical protein